MDQLVGRGSFGGLQGTPFQLEIKLHGSQQIQTDHTDHSGCISLDKKLVLFRTNLMGTALPDIRSHKVGLMIDPLQ